MFYDLVKARRSVRKFQDKVVEAEKIEMILKSALMSPSSRGIKSWEFIAVTDGDLLQKLSKSRENGVFQLSTGKLAIVVAEDPEACDVWVEDASIAAIMMQLTAQSLGLGSCWIQIRNRFGLNHVQSGEIVKNVLGIPEKYDVDCMLVIGYPDEEKAPHDDSKLLFNKIHHEKW